MGPFQAAFGAVSMISTPKARLVSTASSAAGSQKAACAREERCRRRGPQRLSRPSAAAPLSLSPRGAAHGDCIARRRSAITAAAGPGERASNPPRRAYAATSQASTQSTARSRSHMPTFGVFHAIEGCTRVRCVSASPQWTSHQVVVVAARELGRALDVTLGRERP